MRRIAIVGAGQSGLQLALGLLAAGYHITLVSNRSADDIAGGSVLSSQCMFGTALQTERDLGVNSWERECPRVEGIGLTVRSASGRKSIDWAAKLDRYAQSVDQRIKIPGWMAAFEERGGELAILEAEPSDLEGLAASHDLVIVASGKGAIGDLFERDAAKSEFDRPMRALALTYVTGMKPREPYAVVSFNVVPGIGEYFAFPALTLTGRCAIMVFEGVPGGPMDCWTDDMTPEEHLEKSLGLLEEYLPWEAQRCRSVELTDRKGTLAGRFAPVVRKPVGALGSGAKVLGMADAIVLNDPITGQGSNNAAKCADIYLRSILERGCEPFDAVWMGDTFNRYWGGYARWVVRWTNALLEPPAPHVLKLLATAATMPSVASTIADGFDDPLTFNPWWYDPVEADRFLEDKALQTARDRFERRDFRKALAEFATGVTVATTRASDGRPVGVTANSFSSISLDPPLVLWSLSKQARSLSDFTSAGHFAINVLAANQHHLSRQFSTTQPDKFVGVEYTEGTAGVPLLSGVIARFVCRNVKQYEGGDHLIFIGEVESYERLGGEPLVFHSGNYRVATRHPDLPE